MTGFILQDDSVDAPEVLRNSGIFFRVVQLIINSRLHIRLLLRRTDTIAAFFLLSYAILCREYVSRNLRLPALL